MTDKRLLRVLPVQRWPTREEAAQMEWFRPLSLGPVRAEARTWVPAMVPWRASEDGHVTPEVVDWYRRFAEGYPGVLVVEATGVREIRSGPLLRISDDRFIPGLQRLVRAVREASSGRTRLLIQLIDFLAIRRRPPPEKFFRRFLRVDDGLRRRALETGLIEVRDSDDQLRERLLVASPEVAEDLLDRRQREDLLRGYREQVTDVHLPHVRDLPSTLPGVFADAASRAEAAGFDGVELHYAHAYTMASFLSARNDRKDGYGGGRAGRARLPLEVLHAVKDRIGPHKAVGLRFLGDEAIAGGSTLGDAVWFAERFAEAGAHFLSVSKGGKFEDAKAPKVGQAIYPYTGPSGHECMPTARIKGGAFGRNVPLAAAIRARLREAGWQTPVVTAGGIASPWQAEAVLKRGEADAVAAARQTLCDPDWFEKVRQGCGDEVRRCFFTNYCEALDQAHKQVTCQRWDRLGLDETVGRSSDGRRRLTPPQWRPSSTSPSSEPS